MHLNYTAHCPGHVIPVTPAPPNHNARTTTPVTNAHHDRARSIATRITANTEDAKTIPVSTEPAATRSWPETKAACTGLKNAQVTSAGEFGHSHPDLRR